ncbi:hypothetical protein KFE25_008170 [Diacronema lutheri]|uniref:Uncharacterized protein n=1 Tax=Diacronema lutheri TaxID=2081491 RepID=A0A8J6CD62_DIALT|nr:hypothetical protein KFE25_008170 [Diacronema lutheri]
MFRRTLTSRQRALKVEHEEPLCAHRTPPPATPCCSFSALQSAFIARFYADRRGVADRRAMNADWSAVPRLFHRRSSHDHRTIMTMPTIVAIVEGCCKLFHGL